jgi:hypothetical protein
MFYSPDTKLFRAVNCQTNNYGVKEKTTGLAAYPCRACPAGMETDDQNIPSKSYLATNGFIDPKACVTKVGFGYNGRVATQCRPDSYNAAGNYGTCTQCPTGAANSTLAASAWCSVTLTSLVGALAAMPLQLTADQPALPAAVCLPAHRFHHQW